MNINQIKNKYCNGSFQGRVLTEAIRLSGGDKERIAEYLDFATMIVDNMSCAFAVQVKSLELIKKDVEQLPDEGA